MSNRRFSTQMTYRIVLQACCWGLGLAWSLPSMSQANELKLGEALELAARYHPSVKSRQSDLQAAQGDLDTAKWSRYPTVSTEATASGGRPQGALLVQQPLWAGGKIDAQNRLASANVKLAEAALQEARISLMQQTGQQFFEAIRWRQRLEVAKKNEDEHRKLLELIQRRVTAEISAVSDQVLATARLQQAVSERIQFQRSLSTAELSLQQLVGQPLSTLREPKALSLPPSDENQVLASTKASSAELLRLRTQQEVSQAQIDMAQAVIYPTLALAHRRALGGTDNGTDPSRTYLSLQFSPGPGLSARSTVAAAQSRLESSLQNAVVYERQLEQQARTALADLEALGQQVAPAQALVNATEDVVASYLRQYQVGKKNWLDVLNALRESAQATYSAVDVTNSTQSLQLRLMLLTGHLNAQNLSLIHD
jgi:adhesin transport system outer membrane protein